MKQLVIFKNNLYFVFYNNAERLVVQSKQVLLDETLLTQTTSYTFTKKPLAITTQVTRGGMSKTITQTNTYNRYNDMIESITLNAGNGNKKIASYIYDDLGRLSSVARGGNAGTVSYGYNIRGWLKSITSPRFNQTLSYTSSAAYPCYNGNIARMQWKTGNDNIMRGYDFDYDDLNRLTASLYAEGSDMSLNKDRYSENILDYSANGSIERLQRYGKKNNGAFGLIDDLTYQYNGNQIKCISDKARSLAYDGSFDFKDGTNADTEYFYNANGALVKDLNKSIANIEYDVLGNLKCITFNNGFKTSYVYDANGNKLRTSHTSVVTNTTDYVGDFIFEDGKLRKYQFEGGYCSFDGNLNPIFHYYEKDHLGSIRMVVNEDGMVEQVIHYYPFGGIYGDLSYNSEHQHNKYIGKEFDHMHGLDWYDHGARMYDAARVVWDRVDKFTNKYNEISPYAYCMNNPILKIDLDGNAPGDFFLTMDDAAMDFGMFYNGHSIKSNKEYGSTIYEVWDANKGFGYSYSVANIGKREDSVTPSLPYTFHRIKADIHTHGAYSYGKFYDNTFSGIRKRDKLLTRKERKEERNEYDIGLANKRMRIAYVVTPNGSLQKYNPHTGNIEVLSNELPSDPNDPDHINENNIVIIISNTDKEKNEELKDLYNNNK